ncbi:MAG: TerC family protein [Kofleriaceae bacterium]
MVVTYLAFVVLILALVALDLGVLHRRDRVDSVKAALGWSALWVSLGLAFSGVIYLGYHHQWLGLGTTAGGETSGGTAAVKYLTGFLVEKSLAIDNIFVIAMVFGGLKIPTRHQHRVLYWGILGALVMRGLMIGLGAALITRFAWIIYVFGGFLIVTGVKMMMASDDTADVADSRLVRLIRRVIPVTERLHGRRMIVRAGVTTTDDGPPDPVVAAAARGARLATPLLVALILVEATDLIFAVDSIPAIFAITTDPFIVFTSNVFAILGLRSLYFALAGMLDRFRYLKPALAAVLVIIGAKMLAHGWLKAWLGDAFNFYVMGVVLGVIAAGVVTSLWATRGDGAAGARTDGAAAGLTPAVDTGGPAA